MQNRLDIDKIPFFTTDVKPYGRTYGYWTVRWWRWFLSAPKSVNPVIDWSGKLGYVNQPSNDVWFLAGKVVSEVKKLPSRLCRIPTGRSILFPVINYEANQLEFPELRTFGDIIDRVKLEEDTITEKSCCVNGVSIPPQRVRSDPIIFGLRLRADNVVNAKGGIAYVSADGYWVFLKSLLPGNYDLSFHGSCKFGRVYSGASYRLEVSEPDNNQ
jgi:hypothetical protein